MSYTLVWRQTAVAGLIRIRVDDPLVAKAVRSAVAALANDPDPDTSTALGSGTQRRLRVGAARVMYSVSEENISVDVLTVGRIHGE